MSEEDLLLAYFGHHKCATQWMRSIVADVCEIIGRQQLVYNGFRDFDRDLGGAIDDPASTFLCYMNAEKRYARQLGNLRGFHVVRDPRDVVVSAYFSHLYSHPLFGKLEEHRELLKSIPEDEGILLELESRRFQFQAMLDWDYAQPDVLELRMEDITKGASSEIPNIFSFLGLGTDDGLTAERIKRIVTKRDFKQLAGRPPGKEDVTSHYRKGIAGDWLNHFTADHVAYFKEHYGALLILLGYESSNDW